MVRPVLKEVGDHAILYVMASDGEYGANLKRRIIPLITGYGAVEAAVALSATLARLDVDGNLPSLVVSLGSGSSRSLEQACVYQVSSVSDLSVVVQMPFEIPGLPKATLSTHEAAEADMVDGETFAIARTCQFHRVPSVALRSISRGAAEDEPYRAEYPRVIDEQLAEVVDRLETALAGGRIALVG